MSPRRTVALTARREIREALRSRAFRIGIAIQVAIVLAIVIISGVTGGDGGETYDLGSTDARSEAVVAAAADAAGELDAKVEARSFDSAAAARGAVEDGDVDAVVDGSTLLIGADPSETLVSLLQGANREVRGSEELRSRGLSEAETRAALHPPPLELDELDDGSSGEGIAFIGSLYLYIVLLITGMSVAIGVTEEKSTRVVEVILAAIKPLQLLAGKVLGLGLLGLGQVLLISAVGVGSALAIGSVELPPGTAEVVILVIVYFLAGYLLYACAFAAAGAIVSRQEDVQSSTAPLSMLLIGGYIAGISAGPDSPLATVLTLFPPVAPMVVPARAAQDALPLWELALSLVLMAVAIVVMLWVAARIYERAILHMGAPLRLRQALKLVR
jgi:ABC-2 type transport system permease protein